jgi:hypothetical protein
MVFFIILAVPFCVIKNVIIEKQKKELIMTKVRFILATISLLKNNPKKASKIIEANPVNLSINIDAYDSILFSDIFPTSYPLMTSPPISVGRKLLKKLPMK